MSDTERPVSAPSAAMVAARWAGDVTAALRFFSRLPVPKLPFETDPHAVPDFTRLPRALAPAAAVIALPAALVLAACARFGVPALPTAGLAVAVLVVATGALHEDGLADVADGFGGGHMVERRLAIMADSRIGAFGAAALVLALLLRVSLLAAILDARGAAAAIMALLAAAAVSRVAMVVPMALLPAVRPGGRSASVGRPGARIVATAAAIGAALALLLAGPSQGLGRVVAALVLAAMAALGMTALSRRMLGGQTGDVAGATQVVSEIAVLIVLSTAG